MDRTSTVGTVKTSLFFRNLSSKSECCNMKSWHHFFIYWPTFPSVISYVTAIFFFAYLSATIPTNHEAKKCLQSSAYLNFIIAVWQPPYVSSITLGDLDDQILNNLYVFSNHLVQRTFQNHLHPCFLMEDYPGKLALINTTSASCRRTVTNSRENRFNSHFYVGILWIYKVNRYFDVPYF
jgi:hypothetical protein